VGRQKPKYRLAKISDKGGDLSKQWYVQFGLLNLTTGKMKYHREFVSNQLHTTTERYAAAIELRDTINHLLQSGQISPENTEADEIIQHQFLCDGLREYLAFKKPFFSERTFHSYNQITSNLIAWLKDTRRENIFTKDFKPILANEFMRHLAATRSLKAKTYNGYTGYLSSIFEAFVKKEILSTNPFKKVELLPVTQSEIRLWTEKEKTQFFSWCRENDPDLFLIALLVYRAFLRPAEVTRLQVKDIDQNSGLIRVPGSKSKNKTGDWVTLTRQLTELLASRCVELSPDTYLFSKNLLPGPGAIHRNRIDDRFSLARKASGIDTELKLYSLKHTGNSELLEIGVSTEQLKKQNRHHSIVMTEVYAKRIGKKAINEIRDLGDV